MRLVMMGTGPFAVPTFEALLDSRHQLDLLVTRPVPPPVGRRRAKAIPNPMRDVATAHDLTIFEPPSINEASAIGRLREVEADLFVVCDYGQILSAEALSCAKLGGINLHASILPKYRGAAPINWALFHGESETGVTVIHMTPRLDAGPSLLQASTKIRPEEDAAQLEARLAKLGVATVLDSIEMLDGWNGEDRLGIIQDESVSSRAPRLKKSDGLIDWQRAAEEIACQVRAFQPWPGAYTEWQRKKGPVRLLISQCHVDDTDHGQRPAGTVASVSRDHLSVACGKHALAIDRIQPAGKKVQPISEFLRGYPIKVGEQLC